MVSHRGGNGFNADFKAVLTRYLSETAVCNMCRIEKGVLRPGVWDSNRCQLDRQPFQTLPAFTDHGVDLGHGRAENYPE